MKRGPSRCTFAVEGLEGRALLASGSPDLVGRWITIALDAIRIDRTLPGPTPAARNLAVMHTAIFNAIEAIDQSFAQYGMRHTTARWANQDAAAAAAGYVT